MSALLAVVFACVAVPQSACAFGYTGHADLGNKCLGIDVAATKKAGGYEYLDALYREAQKQIDVYRNGVGALTEYGKIREVCPWFSWGKYGHRLLFHWGFNNAPKEHPPLVQQVNECLKRGGSRSAPLDVGDLQKKIAGSLFLDEGKWEKFAKYLPPEDHSMLPPKKDEYEAEHPDGYDRRNWSEADKQAQRERLERLDRYRDRQPGVLWNYLLSLQRQRNNKLIDAVELNTGIKRKKLDGAAHGGAANALATLIYDVHILGDYESSWADDSAALPPIEKLEEDLTEKGLHRLAFGRGKSTLNSELYQQFKQAALAGRGRINKYRARCLLEAVEIYLPQILHDLYADVLRERGIILKPVESIAYKEAA